MAAKKSKKKPPKNRATAKRSTPKKPVAKKPVAKKRPAATKKAAAKKKPAAKKPAAKKPAAKKPAAKKPAAKKPAAKGIQRRDRPGHIDPTYAKQLRRRSGPRDTDDAERPAFRVQDDDLAEELGEEVVGKATTGEDEGEDVANEDYVEEVGGPFVVTTGREEYAEGTDESNPEDATVEPFPKT